MGFQQLRAGRAWAKEGSGQCPWGWVGKSSHIDDTGCLGHRGTTARVARSGWVGEEGQTIPHPHLPPQPQSATEAGMAPSLWQKLGNFMIRNSESPRGDAGPIMSHSLNQTPLSHTRQQEQGCQSIFGTEVSEAVCSSPPLSFHI